MKAGRGLACRAVVGRRRGNGVARVAAKISPGQSCEPSRGLREFLEGKTRNLGDDVINARLEARGGFARDVVLEFVEQVADGFFKSNFFVAKFWADS